MIPMVRPSTMVSKNILDKEPSINGMKKNRKI